MRFNPRLTDKVIKEFRDRTHGNPNNAWWHLVLGMAFEQKERLNDALDEYWNATTRDRKLTEAESNYNRFATSLHKTDSSGSSATNANISVKPGITLGPAVVLGRSFKVSGVGDVVVGTTFDVEDPTLNWNGSRL